MAASLVGLGLAISAGWVAAQDTPPSTYTPYISGYAAPRPSPYASPYGNADTPVPTTPARVLHFSKPASPVPDMTAPDPVAPTVAATQSETTPAVKLPGASNKAPSLEIARPVVRQPVQMPEVVKPLAFQSAPTKAPATGAPVVRQSVPPMPGLNLSAAPTDSTIAKSPAPSTLPPSTVIAVKSAVVPASQQPASVAVRATVPPLAPPPMPSASARITPVPTVMPAVAPQSMSSVPARSMAMPANTPSSHQATAAARQIESPIQWNQATAIRPVAFQPPASTSSTTKTDESLEYQVQLEPPGPQRLFRLESESSLQERIRQEARERPQPERIQFPEEPVIGKGVFAGRHFAERDMVVEPNYVCYGRLFFEDKNTERYGWDLGFVQPFASTAHFVKDLAFLPYHLGTEPCRTYECSAGYCLPGDPVPYMLYPPQFSLTGLLAEAATVGALLAIFP